MKRRRISDAALDELAAIVTKFPGRPEWTRDDLEYFGVSLLKSAARVDGKAHTTIIPAAALDPGPLDPNYPGRCGVCGGRPEWADATGIKCGYCYMAFRGRLVPQVAATDRDSWYSAEDLGRFFRIGKRKAARLAETRVLNARKVHGSGFLLFMERDNPGVFPPRKALRESEVTHGPDWREHPEYLALLEKFPIVKHSGKRSR